MGKTMRDSVLRASPVGRVFDVMRVPRGAALLMWKRWQTLMPRRSGEAPI